MRSLAIVTALASLTGCAGQPAKEPLLPAAAVTEVTVYDDFPPAYSILGDVEARTTVENAVSDKLPDDILASVKDQATKLGANGVKIESVMTAVPRGPGKKSITMFAKGKALHVPAASTETVTIYRSAPSGAFQVLGDIQSSTMVEVSGDNLPESVLASLRSAASQLGANGVLIGSVESTSFAGQGRDGTVQVSSGTNEGIPTVVKAKAIRVPPPK